MPPRMLNEMEQEITALLSDLIKIDTTNPPGNESEATNFLAKDLERDGFECELLESTPGRGNLVSRLKGTNEKSSLLLLSHLDVVPANPKEWSADPFSGLVKDGFVWGRGALDMKSMTAMEVMVMKLLKRNGVKLRGDVVLAATADEEKGGEMGAGWLVREHSEKVRADYVLNEGGGLALPLGNRNLYTVQTAEKGILWFRVKAKGQPGHGSVPGTADNAILRINSVIEKIRNYHPEIKIVPVVREYIDEIAKQDRTARPCLTSLLEDPDRGDNALDEFAKQDKSLAEEFRAKVKMTITPTMIQGGVKENIIPSECEAVFDCRILPGQNPMKTLDMIKGLLKDVGLEKLQFEVIQANEPSESSSDTNLFRLIAEVLHESEANCSVAPDMLTGGTDSRFFRKMGSVCYGFQPMRADMPYGEILKGIHGIDERISIENLVFGTTVLYETVKRFMT